MGFGAQNLANLNTTLNSETKCDHFRSIIGGEVGHTYSDIEAWADSRCAIPLSSGLPW